jgi:hypothetical protein
VWYFADLDARGLLPRRQGLATQQLANRRLAVAGLVPVRPAVALYRLLLACGTPGEVDRPLAAAALAGLVAWLPVELYGPPPSFSPVIGWRRPSVTNGSATSAAG